MSPVWFVFLIVSLIAVEGQVKNEPDTEITRVKTLTEEQRRIPQSKEKTRSIYLVNLLPVPTNGQQPNSDPTSVNNHLGDAARPSNDPKGRPTLFLLQKVNDDGRLPDGIYYRPAEDETDTPPPVIQKDLTDVQSYILARGPYKSPGRQ
ncbi:uncharacterized protein LOC143911857 [Arctopsyche grandis]|uniref:uncharacterized protein LOC143911857 n=1 Tax=Arctopsyche grandis TaxID=121162 RepID=UPI00406D9EA7